MTPMGGDDLLAYGLARNPFLRRPLNPLDSDDDRDCISKLDGWKDLDVAAKDLIARKISDEKPVFFALVGAGKTGRTTIANYLVHLWADARGGKEAVFLNFDDQKYNSGTYSIPDTMTGWIQQFVSLNIKKQLGLAESTLKCLDGLSSSNWNSSRMSEALLRLEGDLQEAKSGRRQFLAAVFEHGRGDELVMKITDSFKHTQAIVIATIDDTRDSEKLVASARAGSDWQVLDLKPIHGADVATLIEDQWDRVGNGENPFELKAVPGVFDTPRPIGQVVRMLAWLMEDTNAHHPGVKDAWPLVRTLKINEQVLRTFVTNYDRELQSARR